MNNRPQNIFGQISRSSAQKLSDKTLIRQLSCKYLFAYADLKV